MDSPKLTQFYDDLKAKLDNGNNPDGNTIRVGTTVPNAISMTPGAEAWRNKATKESERLKEDCRKRIILDIYCKIVPLDDEYVCGHNAQMKGDVDSMLDNKGMTATKYLTSCFESTHAPLLEFILRSTDNIGRKFMEDANDTLKDAQENDLSIPESKADADSKEIEDQLVDVKTDNEYETFIDKLKEKTVNKIVNDVSKIINNKKEEKDMTFDTNTIADDEAAMESTISVGINYLQNKLFKENVEVTPDMQEDLIGMAIRESALNQIDIVFGQPMSDFRDFSSKIRFGKGAIINESAVHKIMESVNS